MSNKVMEESVLAAVRQALGAFDVPEMTVVECVRRMAKAAVAQEQAEPVIADIVAERGRQDAKFGEQNHAAGTWALILLEEIGEWAKEELDRKFNGLQRDNRRVELVQVAAVAMAMVQAMDRGASGKGQEERGEKGWKKTKITKNGRRKV